MQTLRIAKVWHGATETLERGTNPKLARRTCSPRYGLRPWRGKSAGGAKRPREPSPTRNLTLRFATFRIAVPGRPRTLSAAVVLSTGPHAAQPPPPTPRAIAPHGTAADSPQRRQWPRNPTRSSSGVRAPRSRSTRSITRYTGPAGTPEADQVDFSMYQSGIDCKCPSRSTRSITRYTGPAGTPEADQVDFSMYQSGNDCKCPYSNRPLKPLTALNRLWQGLFRGT
jgi:hypothetical protein